MKYHRVQQSVTHLAALASLAAYFFAFVAAHAAQSEWVRSEGGDIRIVAERPAADGTIPAILDIRLKPGWKTYWLEPGASGIPPQVTVDPATGISISGLRFPPPKSFDDGIVRYTGYDHSVALPLLLKSDGNGDLQLKASVFIGICKDICIPLQADVSLSLPAGMAENPLDKARIDDAFAKLPAAPSDAFKVTSASFDAVAGRLHLSLAVPGPSIPTELFLAGPPGYSFGKPEKVSIADGRMTAEVPVRVPTTGGALKSGSVLLVVKSGERSIETALAFD